MSSGTSGISELRIALAELQVQLAALALRVERLEAESAAGFEVVSSPPTSSGACPPSSASAGAVLAEDTAGRTSVAQQIGHFLARCLAGEDRGSSGRDRLQLQSKVYIVLADFSGHKFSSPQIFFNFGDVKAACKRGSSAGDSIFVGLPSKWEARLALRTAGLAVPAALDDGRAAGYL